MKDHRGGSSPLALFACGAGFARGRHECLDPAIDQLKVVVDAGRAADVEELARRYPEAYRNFKTAVTYMPGHGASSRQLEALVGKAKEFYEEGYRLKDTDPDTARQRWKLVMQIVPTNNEYYRKAKQRLDALP